MKPDRSRIWAWVGLLLPAVVIVGVVALGDDHVGSQTSDVGSVAPAFALPTTLGTEMSLEGALAGGDALLYFSMGVGCDGCFAQIPEIQGALAEIGTELVPVMVQPADQVAAAARRFGIASAVLIDEDRSVSSAYNMLGVYGHSDRPSHSFALVGPDHTIKWVKHYASMFVQVDDLLTDMSAA